jgi:hypothetical protein
MISRYSHVVDTKRKELRKMEAVPHRQQYEARQALRSACREVKAYRQEGADRK